MRNVFGLKLLLTSCAALAIVALGSACSPRVVFNGNIIIEASPTPTPVLPLTISPSALTMEVAQTQTFSSTGGVGAVTFSKLSGGGSWDSALAKYTAPNTPETATFRATDSLGNTSDATLTITHGVATQLAFSSLPANGSLAGADLSSQIQVEIQDAFGNRVTSGPDANDLISLSNLTSQGIVAGVLTKSAVSGLADFTGNQIRFELAGPTTLRATTTLSTSATLSRDSSAFQLAIPSFTRLDLLSGPQRPHGNADGAVSSAKIHSPERIADAGGGILYISDSGTHTIRKLDLNTSTLTTIAGTPWIRGLVNGPGASAQFSSPKGLAIVGNGLYVADNSNYALRRIDLADGFYTVSTLIAGYGSTDGLFSAAKVSGSQGLLYTNGKLYMTTNCVLREIDLDAGTIATVAGSTSTCGYTDGVGTAATFNDPKNITTVDSDLLITDGNRLRRVTLPGFNVFTVYGEGDTINSAKALGTGEYFLGNTYMIKRVTPAPTPTPSSPPTATAIAGENYWTPGYVDAIGTSANLGTVKDSYVIDSNTVLFIEPENGAIRQVDIASKSVTTYLGTSNMGVGKVAGSASVSRYRQIQGACSDGTYTYFADTYNHVIRRVDPVTGASSVFAGALGSNAYVDGIGGASRFSYPTSLACTRDTLYVVENANGAIRKIDIATQNVVTFLGVRADRQLVDGDAASARFRSTQFMTMGGGYLFITDSDTVRKVSLTDWSVSTIAGQYPNVGCLAGTGASSSFSGAYHLTYLNGFVYLVAQYCTSVFKIDVATGATTQIVGAAGGGYADGASAVAKLSNQAINGITTDGIDLYVADTGNGLIRKIDGSSFVTSTWAGSPRMLQDRDGLLLGESGINQPLIPHFSFGNFFVTTNSNIRVAH